MGDQLYAVVEANQLLTLPDLTGCRSGTPCDLQRFCEALELIANAARHQRAARVEVGVSNSGAFAICKVSDDGAVWQRRRGGPGLG
jgi:hypothetical protein